MTNGTRRTLGLATAGFALLAAATWGVATMAARDGTPAKPVETPKAEALPVYPALVKAGNPATLHVQADDRAVSGWISGTEKFGGKEVSITLDGKTATATLNDDNTFQWNYALEKPAVAEFRFGAMAASLPLAPPAAKGGPSAFFIVDRTAYRPGQPLHFAAFLRTEDEKGEFVPVANKEVTVQLVSQQKKTKAASIKLVSDERGRIVGSYVFADGDSLDGYDLTAAGYKGTAHVLLGEYRKSKVRLKITGAAADGRMTLRFEPLDFLEKPVAFTAGSFTAQIVRKASNAKTYALKSEDFVHHEARTGALADIASLNEDELLYQEAEGVTGLNFRGVGNAVLHQFNGAVPAESDKAGTHAFELKPEWRKGDCEVLVSGVITDANGREQRATASVAIAELAQGDPEAKPLEVRLKRTHWYTGEPIDVRAAGGALAEAGDTPATLLVMKLAFQTPSSPLAGLYAGQFGQMDAIRSRRYRPLPAMEPGPVESVRRTLTTAMPMAGGEAKLTLKDPGAYKLIVVVPDADGGSMQKEATIVVKRPEDAQPFTLMLDKEEIDAGGKLSGTIYSRYEDARALLTLRDSAGVRWTKPIAFANGSFKLDEALPAGLKYGCSLDVAYPDGDEGLQFAQAFVRVAPADRMLKLAVGVPEEVPPGSPVTVDLSVNRTEPVDLVVSVYDKSLLGIAADKSVDIRDFYLADDRADPRFALAQLQRRVGAAKLGTLFEKAEKMLKDGEKAKDKKLTDAEKGVLQNMLANRKNRHLYSIDLATLLRIAGVDVYFTSAGGGYSWYWRFPDQAKPESADGVLLRDLFESQQSGWHLERRFVGGTLVLHETHTSYAGNPYFDRWHPLHGRAYGYGFGGYGNYWGMNNFYQGAGDFAGGFRSAGMARGDGAFSVGGNGTLSMNSAMSFMPEGQGFLTHMPLGGAGGPALIEADADQGGIAVRRDFSDSAFWNANVRTDANGKAQVSFKLPDSLTNWQVVVTAVSDRMHVGQAKAGFRTFKPIMVWPMLPRNFTEGDAVNVFASVHNRTDAAQTIKVRLKTENGDVRTPAEKTIEVPAKGNAPVYWTFAPGKSGFTQLLMSAECTAGSDASLKRLPVVRSAAEQVVTVSGKVKGEATIELPEGFDPANAKLELTFAPTLAADMADTLNYLVDYPYGCVEQTMSRFLPVIKVSQILKQYRIDNPALEAKLPQCVAGGIKRLLDLQQADGGWGWNGNAQTHEMMTPYALYGLLQAEKAGHAIPNETAIERGVQRLTQFIQAMGDGQASDRMYCLYVFNHRQDLQPEWWKWVEARSTAKETTDYALALALEMAVQRGKKDLADRLGKRLVDRAQKTNGHAYWETAGFSRWGDDRFEITAAAMKALVAWNKDEPVIDNVLSFFIATKRGDRWNSTKDTAMILYALTDFLAKAQYGAADASPLKVAVNGADVGEVKFDDRLTKKLSVDAEHLKPGKNVLRFDTKTTGVVYRAVFRWWRQGNDIPASSHGLEVKRTFHLLDDKGAIVRELKSGDAVPRGSYVASVVEAKNALPMEMRYLLVENPKPATGETVPADDPRFAAATGGNGYVLREDREAHVATHFEQTPQAMRTANVFLAELAGEYTVPPAKAELMYHTETRGHSGTFRLKVEEKK